VRPKRTRDTLELDFGTAATMGQPAGEMHERYFLVDLDEGHHSSRVKLDLHKREEELHFSFRMADCEKLQYLKGRDFIDFLLT
jgi:hypothetical protein